MEKFKTVRDKGRQPRENKNDDDDDEVLCKFRKMFKTKTKQKILFPASTKQFFILMFQENLFLI